MSVLHPYDPINCCVFPVAGMGTRFLPVTKNLSKELLPLMDRPIIQYGVQEAVDSGCSKLLFITGAGKSGIRDYFSPDPALELFLEKNGKIELAERIRTISKMAEFIYATQHSARGLGDAVYCARDHVHDAEYWGLILPDDVILASLPVISQLDQVRQERGGSVLALERVPHEDTNRYGIVDAEEVAPGIYKINDLLEKPDTSVAPSNLAVIGRYILPSRIFKCIEQLSLGQGNEYQLTDALRILIKDEPLWGVEYKGERMDCGTIDSWVEATVRMAARHPRFRGIMEKICCMQ